MLEASCLRPAGEIVLQSTGRRPVKQYSDITPGFFHFCVPTRRHPAYTGGMTHKHYPETRPPYPSDLTDAQWAVLAPLLPPPCAIGESRKIDIRELCNAIFYVDREGCQWRALPHDFGIPWGTAYGYFRKWMTDGTWAALHAALRERVRKRAGKASTPSALIIDSQSAKTTAQGGVRGCDVHKQVNGRKRFILVDTLGLIWLRLVLAASLQERDGGRQLLELLQSLRARFPRLQLIWADGGYAGQLVEWVASACTWVLTIVKRVKPTGFEVLPHRWIVERTYAWFGFFRRLSKEYEVRTDVSEAMMDVAMIHLMVRRLTGGQVHWVPKPPPAPS